MFLLFPFGCFRLVVSRFGFGTTNSQYLNGWGPIRDWSNKCALFLQFNLLISWNKAALLWAHVLLFVTSQFWALAWSLSIYSTAHLSGWWSVFMSLPRRRLEWKGVWVAGKNLAAYHKSTSFAKNNWEHKQFFVWVSIFLRFLPICYRSFDGFTSLLNTERGNLPIGWVPRDSMWSWQPCSILNLLYVSLKWHQKSHSTWHISYRAL